MHLALLKKKKDDNKSMGNYPTCKEFIYFELLSSEDKLKLMSSFRGGSRISGKGARMYKGVWVSLC